MAEEKIPFTYFIPGIAWFFIVGTLTLIPGKNVPEVNWLNIPYLDKIVHMGLFGGLTLLFCLPYFKSHFSLQKKINRFFLISLIAFVWGFAVEVLQKFFVVGRSFEWADLLADGVGVAFAFFISKSIAKKIR